MKRVLLLAVLVVGCHSPPPRDDAVQAKLDTIYAAMEGVRQGVVATTRQMHKVCLELARQNYMTGREAHNFCSVTTHAEHQR